ncbi:MAG TPA: hypothetical protein VI457_07510 [Methylococcaceae bacterium]|nr:hypothetical protein [Methylococcaceae bacterium]
MNSPKHAPLKVGDKWPGTYGKTWEVVELLPFGYCRVRTTDLCRVGEMRQKAARECVARAAKGGATPHHVPATEAEIQAALDFGRTAEQHLKGGA